ncbi:NAD(P)-dependent oxidoreductase [bacterium]|jgi:nucleoside-diphosphate-sugar epimerase|nr:NAD(P)-dependent oxidoreductase [bacterium]
MKSTVFVTGCLGNLGWKATMLLASDERFDRVLACDLGQPIEEQAEQLSVLPNVEFVRCDLSRWQDLRWRGRILDADMVIHFAAQNPFPEASWQDVAISMDITNHITTALLASEKPQRLVYISSNHVMGRYKDSLFGKSDSTGRLRTDLELGVGTIWNTGLKVIDSTGYATVKLAGERTCRAVSEASNGRITSVSVRIGWCQPGENHPSTLSAAGSITIERADEKAKDLSLVETDRWFQEMWLSNRDLSQIIEKSLTAPAVTWPSPSIVVNGMSHNSGMVWSLEEGENWLGYIPMDDVYQILGR